MAHDTDSAELAQPLVRRASLDDREAISRVHAAAIRGGCFGHYEPAAIEAWAALQRPDRYTEVITSREFFVAEKADRVVAFVQLHIPSGELEALYVEPGSTNQGIGTLLLRHVEMLARSHGLVAVHLSSSLNAVGFYLHAGFDRIADTEHRLANGVHLPCVKMRKTLG